MRIAVSLLAACLSAFPARVFADGAFPDSMSIFLPPDRPDQIILGTNFGLLISEDAGATWNWVCEQSIAAFVLLYQMGPAPESTLYAVTVEDIAVSNDLACSWTRTATMSSGAVLDIFPDPANKQRVLSLVRKLTTSTDYVYESTDGASSLGRRLYQANPDRRLESLEIAKSDPSRVYVTMTSSGSAKNPAILRSMNGGESFEELAANDLGNRRPFIAAIDPEDPLALYFRVRRDVTETGGDRFAYSLDGGETSTVAVVLDGAMSGFLRRSDRALFVLGVMGSFVSTNGGETFTPWGTAPKLRALGERDGLLYAAADNFMDGFAVGVSRDGGDTWEPLFRFDQIKGPKSCVADACATAWADLKVLFGIEEMKPEPPAASSGCGCTAARVHRSSLELESLVLTLMLLSALRLRRSKASRRGPQRV